MQIASCCFGPEACRKRDDGRRPRGGRGEVGGGRGGEARRGIAAVARRGGEGCCRDYKTAWACCRLALPRGLTAVSCAAPGLRSRRAPGLPTRFTAQPPPRWASWAPDSLLEASKLKPRPSRLSLVGAEVAAPSLGPLRRQIHGPVPGAPSTPDPQPSPWPLLTAQPLGPPRRQTHCPVAPLTLSSPDSLPGRSSGPLISRFTVQLPLCPQTPDSLPVHPSRPSTPPPPLLTGPDCSRSPATCAGPPPAGLEARFTAPWPLPTPPPPHLHGASPASSVSPHSPPPLAPLASPLAITSALRLLARLLARPPAIPHRWPRTKPPARTQRLHRLGTLPRTCIHSPSCARRPRHPSTASPAPAPARSPTPLCRRPPHSRIPAVRPAASARIPAALWARVPLIPPRPLAAAAIHAPRPPREQTPLAAAAPFRQRPAAATTPPFLHSPHSNTPVHGIREAVTCIGGSSSRGTGQLDAILRTGSRSGCIPRRRGIL